MIIVSFVKRFKTIPLRRPDRRYFAEKASINFHKLLKKTPVLETFRPLGNFVKNTLQNRWFPVKFAKFLRTPILKNIVKDCLRKGLQANFSSILGNSITCPQLFCLYKALYRMPTTTKETNHCSFLETALKPFLCYRLTDQF